MRVISEPIMSSEVAADAARQAELFFTQENQQETLRKNMRDNAKLEPSRILNNIDCPPWYGDYVESFLKCIHDIRTDPNEMPHFQVAPDQFAVWLRKFILEHAATDLFDDEGNIKYYFKEIFDYIQRVYRVHVQDAEVAKKKILFSLVSLIYFDFIGRNQHYRKLLDDSDEYGTSNSKPRLSPQFNTYTKLFFQNEIYPERVKISDIMSLIKLTKNNPLIRDAFIKVPIVHCKQSVDMVNTILAQSESNRSNLLRITGTQFTKYLNANQGEILYFISTLSMSQSKKFELLPLVYEGLMTPQSLDQIEFDSIEHRTYSAFVEHAEWQNLPKVKEQFTKLKKLFEGKHYQALKEYVFKPIDEQIETLKNDKVYIAANGDDKSKQMDVAKKDIKTSISSKIVDSIKSTINGSDFIPQTLMPSILANVFTKIEAFSLKNEIAGRRNKVAAFFKGLLGVLLAVPVFCASLLIPGYRDYFFKSSSVARLNSIRKNLKAATLSETSEIPTEQVNPIVNRNPPASRG